MPNGKSCAVCEHMNGNQQLQTYTKYKMDRIGKTATLILVTLASSSATSESATL